MSRAEEPTSIGGGLVRCVPALREDLPEVVTIHRLAFPGFFLTSLGSRFLAEYYRTVLEYDGGALIVATVDGLPCGFVAGFLGPRAFATVLMKRAPRLAVYAAAAFVRQPRLLARFLNTGRRTAGRRKSAEVTGPKTAELASIGVRPESQRGGVGQALVQSFLSTMRAKGAESVRLTTDALANDRVNAFYLGLDFELRGQETRSRGRVMNVYVKSLAS